MSEIQQAIAALMEEPLDARLRIAVKLERLAFDIGDLDPARREAAIGIAALLKHGSFTPCGVSG